MLLVDLGDNAPRMVMQAAVSQAAGLTVRVIELAQQLVQQLAWCKVT